ncbi:NeuB family protein [Brevinema andersonii]|uniref:NeuB family protein n=1 Tax=Brevinema andersonii TaxID=34097 RepID=A0A1I1EXW6_BREAD|nr:N-acetylneuraminate synthase family protein [Brevinema andersonii]SFB92029.1 NeuB family protein [Brevinema andersonii]
MVNHCVSIYPLEKFELKLNQIDFLKNHYPDLVVGFSTHECNADIKGAMLIAYAKGARTFERHVDLDYDGIQLSPYNSLPSDFDNWGQRVEKSKEDMWSSGTQKRVPSKKKLNIWIH